ncbi:hypothetical protein K2X33_00745 [bacterium]|nr:hypothetical protein [bacterium]
MKFLLFLLLNAPAFAAVPVGEMVNDAFSGRKMPEGIEMSLKHVVQVREGSSIEVTETLTGSRSGAVSLWQIGGQSYFSEWTGRDYAFRGKTLQSRSAVWMEYYLDRTGQEFLDRLLREQFVRRDQLSLFDSAYDPKGDPKTWETKDKVARRDDVFFRKVGSDVAVRVQGSRGGSEQKAVYFLRDRKDVSLRRLEWLGSDTATMDFLNPATLSGMGRVPRVISLTVGGSEKVRTTITSVRAAKRDTLATARVSGRTLPGVPTGEAEEALRWILRYR